MTLHARQVAIAAGAEGEIIDRLAQRLAEEKTVRIDRAEEILKEWEEGRQGKQVDK
jgi:hydroxymethylglutaryl-CoA reductase